MGRTACSQFLVRNRFRKAETIILASSWRRFGSLGDAGVSLGPHSRKLRRSSQLDLLSLVLLLKPGLADFKQSLFLVRSGHVYPMLDKSLASCLFGGGLGHG